MEELNNKLVEETMEIVEPTEVLDSIETIADGFDTKQIVMGAVIATGVIAGVYGLKRLLAVSKRKIKAVEVTKEFSEIQDNLDEVNDTDYEDTEE